MTNYICVASQTWYGYKAALHSCFLWCEVGASRRHSWKFIVPKDPSCHVTRIRSFCIYGMNHQLLKEQKINYLQARSKTFFPCISYFKRFNFSTLWWTKLFDIEIRNIKDVLLSGFFDLSKRFSDLIQRSFNTLTWISCLNYLVALSIG